MKLADLIGFVCFGIAVIILWQFRQILLLLFTAIVLAIALNSLVRQLVQRLEIARGRAVILALGLVVLVGVIFLGIIVPLFVDQFEQLLQILPDSFRQFSVWLNNSIDNPPPWLPIPDVQLLPNYSDLIQQAASLSQQIFGNFLAFFSSSLGVLLQLLLVVVLTLMLLGDPLAYRRLTLRLFPSFYRRRADAIFSECESALLNWLGAVCISSVFVAVVSAIGLSLLQVEFVFANALLAGVFNFIPNIGPTLSAAFPVLVALLDSPGKAIAVIGLYLVIQNVESYWFNPMVMQKQVSLLPAATLVAQLFFATFLGPLGLILALPLAVVIKTWLEEAVVKDLLDHWHSLHKTRIPPTEDLAQPEASQNAQESLDVPLAASEAPPLSEPTDHS